jgi:hypothetical protein
MPSCVAICTACGPDSRTIPTPPVPAALAMATMVDVEEDMGTALAWIGTEWVTIKTPAQPSGACRIAGL